MWMSGGGLACGLVVVMETKAQIEWQGHQYVFQYGKETAGQEALAFRLQSQRDLSAGEKFRVLLVAWYPRRGEKALKNSSKKQISNIFLSVFSVFKYFLNVISIYNILFLILK